MAGYPMVTINRAIAMVHGPAAGLAALASLDTPLAGHHRLDAVRAHLLEMDGNVEGTITHYRQDAQLQRRQPTGP